MKKDIAEFVSRCLVCRQMKVEHQKPVETPKHQTNIGMAFYEALYGKNVRLLSVGMK